MWIDELNPSQSWMGIWSNLIYCGNCKSIMDSTKACPNCGYDYSKLGTAVIEVEGKIIEVPPTFAGAINSVTYVVLTLMQREWDRQVVEDKIFVHLEHDKQPSQRLVIVILFWSLFEGLMDQFFRDGLKGIPEGIRNDLLKRYSSIGSRLDRLYKTAFSSTFEVDLRQLGYGSVFELITLIHDKRNAFIHGNPGAIDNDLVYKTVGHLQIMQEAWVKLYNLRCV